MHQHQHVYLCVYARHALRSGTLGPALDLYLHGGPPLQSGFFSPLLLLGCVGICGNFQGCRRHSGVFISLCLLYRRGLDMWGFGWCWWLVDGGQAKLLTCQGKQRARATPALPQRRFWVVQED